MKTSTSSSSTLLSKYNLDQKVAIKFENIFGLNKSFHALTNLVERLYSLFELAEELGAPNKEERDYWKAFIDSLVSAGLNLNVTAGVTTRHGNPLGGFFGTYPIASYFLQSPNGNISIQHDWISVLFLCAILSNKFSTKKVSENTANIFRVICTSHNKSRNYYLSLTVQSDLKQFCESIKVLSKKLPETHFDKSVITAFNHILLKDIKVPSKIDNEVTVKVPHAFEIVDDQTELNLSGIVCRELPTMEEVLGNSQREYLYIHQAISADDDFTDIVEQADYEARLTRHWVSKLDQFASNDTRNLTYHEKTRLAEYLSRNINKIKSSDWPVTVLLGLTYVLGQEFETICNYKIGQNEQLTPDGYFQRDLFRPKDAYQLTDNDLDFLQVSLKKITLPLPKPFQKALKQLSITNKTIIECLGVNTEDVHVAEKMLLKNLSDHGRYHLTQYKVGNALSSELTLQFKDPLISYYIAGRKEHASPLAAYYISPGETVIQDAYQKVTKRLLNN